MEINSNKNNFSEENNEIFQIFLIFVFNLKVFLVFFTLSFILGSIIFLYEITYYRNFKTTIHLGNLPYGYESFRERIEIEIIPEIESQYKAKSELHKIEVMKNSLELLPKYFRIIPTGYLVICSTAKISNSELVKEVHFDLSQSILRELNTELEIRKTKSKAKVENLMKSFKEAKMQNYLDMEKRETTLSLINALEMEQVFEKESKIIHLAEPDSQNDKIFHKYFVVFIISFCVGVASVTSKEFFIRFKKYRKKFVTIQPQKTARTNLRL